MKNLYYVKYIPSILINGKVFWGNWTAENLMEAVCSSLLYKPDICFTYGGLPGVHSRQTHHIVVILVLATFVVSLIIFFICKYQIQKNINNNLDSSNFGHKINTVVTTYLALKDTSKSSLGSITECSDGGPSYKKFSNDDSIVK